MMYSTFLVIHSYLRWLVVVSLLLAIYRAFRGYRGAKPFSRTDNRVRHWTATIAHMQLMVGIILYTQSPIITYYWKGSSSGNAGFDAAFYALLHIFLMLTAITILTVGSALAKRKAADAEKFKTMLIWFGIAFMLIFIAVPWPFSPLSNRPYIR